MFDTRQSGFSLIDKSYKLIYALLTVCCFYLTLGFMGVYVGCVIFPVVVDHFLNRCGYYLSLCMCLFLLIKAVYASMQPLLLV